MYMKKREKIIELDKKDFYTIPNILCYFRILFVPIFFGCYIYGGVIQNDIYKWVGLAFVLAAILTDFVDGKVARKFNMITELGKFLDPLADKLMQFAISLAIGISYLIEFDSYYAFILIGVFVIKELTQFFIAYYFYRKGKWLDGAKWYGKIATFIFDIVMFVLLLLNMFNLERDTVLIVYYTMISVSIICLVFAFIMYLFDFKNLSKVRDNASKEKYNEGKEKSEND